MFRRVAAPVAISASTQARCITIFSEQNPVLLNNQKHLKYKSNVWVEVEDDKWWYEKATELKKGEKPTTVSVTKRIDLYNLEQLENGPRVEGETTGPTSARTGTAYQGNFQKQLEQGMARKDFQSHWFFTAKEIKKHEGCKVKPRENPIPVFMNINNVAVVNADQFKNPSAIALRALSAGSKKTYGGESSEILLAHAKKNGFKTGLYFSQKQMDAFGLKPKAGATGCALALGGGSAPADAPEQRLYNVDEVQKGAKLVEDLQRFPVDEHMYLLNGRVLPPALLMSAKAVEDKFESRYWVTKNELERLEYTTKPNAAGITLMSGGNSGSFTVYNAEELDDVARAFRVAGKYDPVKVSAPKKE